MTYYQSVLLIAIFMAYLASSDANAQKAAVTEIPVDGGTTIQIRKGEPAPAAEKDFEILDGSAEVAGEPNVMAKAARESWKKACDDWKKEVKELNKDNQVIVLNCNTPKCGPEGTTTVCKSTATYKIKIRLKK